MESKGDAPARLYVGAAKEGQPAFIGFKIEVDGVQYGDVWKGPVAEYMARTVLGMERQEE